MENVKGTKSLLRRLDAIDRMVRDKEQLEDWQTRTVDLAKHKHLPNKKTGTTTRSIHSGKIDRDEAVVEAAGAAVFLEYGTKAHIIRPRNKKMLAWSATAAGRRLSGSLTSGARSGSILARGRKTLGGSTIRNVGGSAGPSSGPVIFAREVNHPGTKPYPFLIPAAEEARDRAFGKDEVYRRWNKAG